MSEEGGQGKAAGEAAEWLARLNSRSVSSEELNAFYEWRRVPENAEAYARGEQIWHDARSLGDDREIAQAVREALERPRLERSATPRIGRRTLLAGGVGLLAVGGTGWMLLSQARSYRTAVGEQLAVRLEDDSLMRLNTDSEASVSYSSGRRRVDITSGQAFFDVRPDSARPFEVRFGGFEVVALGTRFEVAHLEGQAPRVVLVEGRVQVEPAGDQWQQVLSAPGDALFLSGGADRPVVRRVDSDALTSWTTGRLTFRRTPLQAAVAEVNRYSRKQIVLEAPDLQTMEVDGVFEAGDPEAFLSAVTALFPLRARPARGDRIILTRT